MPKPSTMADQMIEDDDYDGGGERRREQSVDLALRYLVDELAMALTRVAELEAENRHLHGAIVRKMPVDPVRPRRPRVARLTVVDDNAAG
jgi:hypothetical protein